MPEEPQICCARLARIPGSVVAWSLSSAGAGTARSRLLWATFSRPGAVSPQVSAHGQASAGRPSSPAHDAWLTLVCLM